MEMSTIICRLCLNQNQPDYSILNENEHLISLIFDYLTIEIVQDSLEDYYICRDCQDTLETFVDFKSRCLQNDAEFQSKYQFKQEISWDIDEPKQMEQIPETVETQEIEIKSESELNVKLEEDPSSEPTKLQTDKYVRDRRKLPCHICGKFISNAQYTVHVSLHSIEGREFSCPICGRSYRQKHNLKKHLNTHTKAVMHPCSAEGCGKQFDSASTLRKHFKIMHTNIRDHVCKICGRGFAIASGLSGHMRTTHCTEKTHGCPECGKLFKTPGEVKLHLKIHTKRDPYPCPDYDESFPKASILKQHRAEVHNFVFVVKAEALASLPI
ncbi:zinc finger protein 699-like [Culex pipiens pallens]|uniref:zinc finger protein 699-like n=1 Tax=Culex pipiens pallens TaxID=42434 RepID=UPI0019547E59|nr:zinc finger protein 699-like [Culex pipiens pallens]